MGIMFDASFIIALAGRRLRRLGRALNGRPLL